MTITEKIRDLQNVLTVRNSGSDNYEVVFKEWIPQNVIDRLETYDMIKDKYTREWVLDFINEFVKRLGVDGDFERLTYSDCDEIYDSIMTSINNNGIDFESLVKWLAANAVGRETYFNDALENHCNDGDSPTLDLFRYAQMTEILQVYDVAYNFAMWFLGIEYSDNE